MGGSAKAPQLGPAQFCATPSRHELLSSLAADTLPDTTRLTGSTGKALGAAPKLHRNPDGR